MAVFLMGKMVINQWMEQGTLSQNGCRLKKYSRSRLVYRPVLNFKTSALVPVIAVRNSYRISFHK